MKYSCFNQASGVYHVFEDSAQIPINGDLPVPALGSDVNGIGVPSIEAGRPLPSGARPVGTSWHPVGMIVSCHKSISGLGADASPSSSLDYKKMALYGAAAAVGSFILAKVLL